MPKQKPRKRLIGPQLVDLAYREAGIRLFSDDLVGLVTPAELVELLEGRTKNTACNEGTSPLIESEGNHMNDTTAPEHVAVPKNRQMQATVAVAAVTVVLGFVANLGIGKVGQIVHNKIVPPTSNNTNNTAE